MTPKTQTKSTDAPTTINAAKRRALLQSVTTFASQKPPRKRVTVGPFAPNIGELLTKSKRVLELAETLCDELAEVFCIFRQKTKEHAEMLAECSEDVRAEIIDAQKGYGGIVCVKEDSVKWEISTALFEAFDAIQNPPVGFEETSSALWEVLGIVKGIRETRAGNDGRFLKPLEVAKRKLFKAIDALEWGLFDTVPTAKRASSKETMRLIRSYDTIESQVLERISCAPAMAKRHGFYGDSEGGYNWHGVACAIRLEDCNATELQNLSPDDDTAHCLACIAYWERQDREAADAEKIELAETAGSVAVRIALEANKAGAKPAPLFYNAKDAAKHLGWKGSKFRQVRDKVYPDKKRKEGCANPTFTIGELKEMAAFSKANPKESQEE